MLGKGLQSLIPPQDDGENRNEEQAYAPHVPHIPNEPVSPAKPASADVNFPGGATPAPEPAVVQPPAYNTMNVSVPDSPSPVGGAGGAYGDDMLPVPFHEIAVPMVQINQTPAASAPVFHRPTPAEPTWPPQISESPEPISAPKPSPVSQMPPPVPAVPESSRPAYQPNSAPAVAATNPVSQMPHTTFVPSKTPQLAHDVPEKYSEPIFHI